MPRIYPRVSPISIPFAVKSVICVSSLMRALPLQSRANLVIPFSPKRDRIERRPHLSKTQRERLRHSTPHSRKIPRPTRHTRCPPPPLISITPQTIIKTNHNPTHTIRARLHHALEPLILSLPVHTDIAIGLLEDD